MVAGTRSEQLVDFDRSFGGSSKPPRAVALVALLGERSLAKADL